MQPLSLLRPHNRWSARLHAYVDGELQPDATERFKGHLAECAACAYAVADARNLKQLLHALPEVPARRSFNLTAAMVSVPLEAVLLAPVPAVNRTPGRLTPAIRFAQVAAGLAVLGLVAAGTADLVGGGQSVTESRSKSAAPLERSLTTQDVAPASAGQDPGASVASAATAAGAAPSGTPGAVLPATGGSGAGAAGGVATPRATQGGNYIYSETASALGTQGIQLPAAAATAEAPYAAENNSFDQGQPVEGGKSNRKLRGVELLLGGLLAASGAAWLFMRTKGNQG